MYVTFSSTAKNERVEGKIQKYYVECKTYKQARRAFWRAKSTSKTHYVSMRMSTPRYCEITHRIVDHYDSIGSFSKKYK